MIHYSGVSYTPRKSCWDKLEKFEQLITLEEFLQQWNVTHSQIARICHCSVSTVNNWFVRSSSSTYRPPKSHHLLRLTIADKVWKSEFRKN